MLDLTKKERRAGGEGQKLGELDLSSLEVQLQGHLGQKSHLLQPKRGSEADRYLGL